MSYAFVGSVNQSSTNEYWRSRIRLYLERENAVSDMRSEFLYGSTLYFVNVNYRIIEQTFNILTFAIVH